MTEFGLHSLACCMKMKGREGRLVVFFFFFWTKEY